MLSLIHEKNNFLVSRKCDVKAPYIIFCRIQTLVYV